MWCFWSAKGGVGCTVVAAGVALGLAAERPTLLVDLGGDLPSMFGREVEGPGMADWLVAPAAPLDALSRLEVDVGHNLTVLPWLGPEPAPAASGTVEPPDRWSEPVDVLAEIVALDHRAVVVDVGRRSQHQASDGGLSAREHLADRLLALAARSTLVTRPCALAVGAADRFPSADEVIVVGRQTRTFGAKEVQHALSVPVSASVRWDPAVARAVDAGGLAKELPRALRVLTPLTEAAVA